MHRLVDANKNESIQKNFRLPSNRFHAKILFRLGVKISYQLNMQFSNAGDIPRYDRLQDTSNETLRYPMEVETGKL